MRYELFHRYTRTCIWSGKIEADEDTPESVKKGLAVRAAVKERANLSHADLTDANLAGADLYGAKLSGANLAYAKLSGANLYGADLAYANLTRANLAYANLYGANLTGANLYGADLAYANLTRANLTRADLTRADLKGANLTGATWRGKPCIRPPIQMWAGLKWPVTILDEHMQIGCELHGLSEWAAFDDRTINAMDRGALKWWRANKDWLLAAAKANGRTHGT